MKKVLNNNMKTIYNRSMKVEIQLPEIVIISIHF